MARVTSARTRVLSLLVSLSYVLAFLQRPGKTVSDTRVELSADPLLFLQRVAHLWSGTTDLGHVQSGQFNGYLFPMGPWFAALHAAGVPMWVAQRLWLGTLLALAAWGVVRLLDELLPRRPVAQMVAGLLFVLNPYVVQFASRGTVALIAYAALPWLMLAAHRGVRRPRGWLWPALVALLLAASGGGVNAALIAFMLLGPAALLAYDAFTRQVRWRDAWSFTWRAGLAGALASAWWAIPVLLQGRYGADFLSFTEQPGTIWATTSLSEGLRQLGFWGLYVGVGFSHVGPFLGVARDYLFSWPVIVASFAVPLLAVAALRVARGWRYTPFFALLAVLTLVVMAAGFPEGTPLRHALNFAYAQLPSGRFLRTTYKAVPLLALCFACLGGVAVATLAERARASALRLRGRRVPAWSVAALVVVALLAALPLLNGTAIDSAQRYSVPPAWPRALADATAAAGAQHRTAIVPGELSAGYTWGATMDPIGPALEKGPVAIREVVPYADQRSSQLQTTVDDLVQQDRLTPGQLSPLLELMGVGQVVSATDSEGRRSDALGPVEAALALGRDVALRGGYRSYGPVNTFGPSASRSGPRLRLPELRRWTLPGGPGLVRVQPESGATVLEGDADGVAGLAGVGALDPSAALFYGPDTPPARLRGLVAKGARIVLTDSSRRRAIVVSRTRANRGPTLPATAPIPAALTRYTPFGAGRSDDETVAIYDTLSKLYAPALPAFGQFPEHRAYAALDGRRDTAWLADGVIEPARRYVEATLRRPLRVPAIRIFPHADALGRTTEVDVSFNGGAARTGVKVSPAGTSVPVPGGELRSLRVRIARTTHTSNAAVAGGIDEIQVPGLRVAEWLRLPTALSSALAGSDLSRNELDVVLERTTADFPRRTGHAVGPPQAGSSLDAVDPEAGLTRQVDLPAARSFGASGWASVGPSAPDDLIDRLAGLHPGWRMTSSSRFEGVPGRRASSAFDGDARTAWVGDIPRAGSASLAWRAPRPLALRRFTLAPGPADYARPRRVRVSAGGGPAVTADVGPGGAVDLGRTLRGASFRLDVLSTAPGPGTRLPAVAIGELRAAGLRAPAPRRRGTFTSPCGALAIAGAAGAPARLAVGGSVADLDAGNPLPLRLCGAPLRMTAGSTLLRVEPRGALRADRLLLRSPAPRPTVIAAEPAGRVLSVSGEGPKGVPDHARLSVQRPAWLVFGQSYSTGWRASCRDASGHSRDLGAPVPIDAFANGWRVQPGCVEASFTFPAQSLALAGFALSALAIAVLLLVAIVAARRARRTREPAPGEPAPLPDRTLRLGWRDAIAAGVAIGVAGGFVFAIRAGAVLLPLSILALRRGVTVRGLATAAMAGVAALPVIYLVSQPKDRGGFNFSYPVDLLGAHWVAVGVVCCMAAAAALLAFGQRAAASGSDLLGPDHAVPGQQLAHHGDAHDEGQPRPVARLDAHDS